MTPRRIVSRCQLRLPEPEARRLSEPCRGAKQHPPTRCCSLSELSHKPTQRLQKPRPPLPPVAPGSPVAILRPATTAAPPSEAAALARLRHHPRRGGRRHCCLKNGCRAAAASRRRLGSPCPAPSRLRQPQRGVGCRDKSAERRRATRFPPAAAARPPQPPPPPVPPLRKLPARGAALKMAAGSPAPAPSRAALAPPAGLDQRPGGTCRPPPSPTGPAAATSAAPGPRPLPPGRARPHPAGAAAVPGCRSHGGLSEAGARWVPGAAGACLPGQRLRWQTGRKTLQVLFTSGQLLSAATIGDKRWAGGDGCEQKRKGPCGHWPLATAGGARARGLPWCPPARHHTSRWAGAEHSPGTGGQQQAEDMRLAPTC